MSTIHIKIDPCFARCGFLSTCPSALHRAIVGAWPQVPFSNGAALGLGQVGVAEPGQAFRNGITVPARPAPELAGDLFRRLGHRPDPSLARPHGLRQDRRKKSRRHQPASAPRQGEPHIGLVDGRPIGRRTFGTSAGKVSCRGKTGLQPGPAGSFVNSY